MITDAVKDSDKKATGALIDDLTREIGEEKWQFKKLMKKVIDDELKAKPDLDYSRLRVSNIASLKVVDFTRAALEKKVIDEKISKRNFITFGIGTVVHKWIQGMVSSANKNLFGEWRCPKCGSKFFGIDVKFCYGCTYAETGDLKFLYGEPYLFIGDKDGIQLGGHPDIIKIVDDKSKFAVVNEIKTIRKDGFERLKMAGPEINHIVQTMLYMVIFEEHIKKAKKILSEGLGVKLLEHVTPEKKSVMAMSKSLAEIENVLGRIYYVNKNDSSELEFGVCLNKDVVNRCLIIYDFYKTCMEARSIIDGCDLDDLNKTVVESIGEDRFVDMWYAV